MDPFTLAAIMAGVGILKSEAIDKPQAEKQRKLAASTQELSPWTGLQANAVKEADPFGTALQFGATGAQMGAGMQEAEANKAVANRLNSGGNLRNSEFNSSLAIPSSESYVKPKSRLWG